MTGYSKAAALIWLGLIGVLVLGYVMPMQAPAQPERTAAVEFWMKRARAAEQRATTAATDAELARAQARDARRRLAAAPSSVEAMRLAAISSSTDPAEQQAMYRTLYELAACETTGTTGRGLPWPPVERVLNHRAQNPTGEKATGLLQFIGSTWRTTPYAGVSIWSPYAQALAAAWMLKQRRLQEWSCAWAVTR